MTTLQSLPGELVTAIVSFLEDGDLRASRLLSKHIERSTFSFFGRRFFRKKGFMITSPSLHVLQSISEHPELRNYVQHLWFNPDCYTYIPSSKATHPSVEALCYAEGVARDNKPPQLQAFLDCTTDHNRRVEVDSLSTSLERIFAQLPNLSVVGMRRSEDYEPWGWRQLAGTVGTDPRIVGSLEHRSWGSKDVLSGSTKLFIAIVNAIAATDNRLIRLYTDAVELDDVHPDLLNPTKLESVFSTLGYLEINSTRSGRYMSLDPTHRISTPDDGPALFGDGLARILKACINLKEIGLQIFPDLKQSHMIPPHADWRRWNESYQYQALRNVSTQVRFRSLTRIKLEYFTTSPESLLKFLPPTLTSVKLRGIRLISTEEEKRPWKPIFSFFHSSCPDLDYILLYHIMYEQGGVSFVEKPPELLLPRDTDITGAPNPTFGETLGLEDGELFTNYEHIAFEAKGKDAVLVRLAKLVDFHWYDKPMFTYAMDDDLWYTDTSDEE